MDCVLPRDWLSVLVAVCGFAVAIWLMKKANEEE
jgi:hypothetical protein